MLLNSPSQLQRTCYARRIAYRIKIRHPRPNESCIVQYHLTDGKWNQSYTLLKSGEPRAASHELRAIGDSEEGEEGQDSLELIRSKTERHEDIRCATTVTELQSSHRSRTDC